MCTRRTISVASAITLMLALASCSSPERTGTSFCGQLAKELPTISLRMTTPAQVRATVNSYERLTERAPLNIESDIKVFTALLRVASSVNPSDKEALQQLANSSYAANQSALAVRKWVKDTCAVDISTGLNITPPRIATTTTTSVSTSVPPSSVP